MTALATDMKLGTISKPKIKDWLSVGDVPGATVSGILDLAQRVKAEPSAWSDALAGKTFVMLFEKPSLRTRLSFEIGLAKLGAQAIFYDLGGRSIGQRESIKDYAQNLSRFCDGIVARVFDHKTLVGLGEHSDVPVINALSDLEHPCQALADYLTLKEQFGELKGLKVAYMGDGNNVCHSLMIGAAALGVHLTVITPKGFEPRFDVVKRSLDLASATGGGSGGTITLTQDAQKVKGHHAVYTDTWTSMGQDHQQSLRENAFTHLQVDEDVMSLASQGVGQSVFMHCLPAHRGEEVTDGVIDSAQSVVYQQAENRMHAQNALALYLYGVAEVE